MNFVSFEEVEVGDLHIYFGKFSIDLLSFFFKKSEEGKSFLVIFGDGLFLIETEQTDVGLGFLWKDSLS